MPVKRRETLSQYQRITSINSSVRLTACSPIWLFNTAGRQRQAVELVSTAFNEMLATSNEAARSCSAAANSADSGYTQAQNGQLHIDEATSSFTILSENLHSSAEAYCFWRTTAETLMPYWTPSVLSPNKPTCLRSMPPLRPHEQVSKDGVSQWLQTKYVPWPSAPPTPQVR